MFPGANELGRYIRRFAQEQFERGGVTNNQGSQQPYGSQPLPPYGAPDATSGIPPHGGPDSQQADPQPSPFVEGGEVKYIDTSSDKAQGISRCPRCGSTEISMRAATGKLICHYCRHEWHEGSMEQSFGLDTPVSELRGTVIASGASNIHESTDDVLTLKCQACGAEVVVNTQEALHARCHWCRNTLTINAQLPNGAVPDGILPFSITRQDAIARITEFVKKRRFFAHPQFTRQFAPEEVVGVYLPYLTMDANARVTVEGEGEIQTRKYQVKVGDDWETRYDADRYRLGRDFNLYVDDVTIESSADRANIDPSRNTNNIINTILPFDTKNAVTYNANYLRGFTSEKRDVNLDGISRDAYERVLSIGRARANELIRSYDRGVRWQFERLRVRGTRWVSLYLPVWLYSYYEERTGLKHYVAVNGRTGETMGSVPVRKAKLLAISGIIGVVGLALSCAAIWFVVMT